ncbi:MAG: hypothetical protein CNLJKLNK_01338 [Holosporales bacterium]
MTRVIFSSEISSYAYLAGPDVFYPNAIEIGEQKKALLREIGVIGLFPMDNELTAEDFKNSHLARNKIAKENEAMMLKCCKEGRKGFILLNMMPWHGPSMDVGTAFECGFMSALAHIYSNLVIIGYTDNNLSFSQRVEQYLLDHNNQITIVDGRKIDSNGFTIEDFADATDNLMITHAIEKTGGKVLYSFEDAVRFLKEKLNED